MNLYAMPAGAPFLESIAAAWLDAARHQPARVAEGMILLPTRRAARALADAFLRRSGGRAMLLPRLAAIGAPDEALLALTGALELPPAVGGAERLAVLTRLILAAGGRHGMPLRIDRAWALGEELALLQDEAEQAGVNLADALPRAVPEEHAAHWQTTLALLSIVTETWPAWLAGQGLMNPVAREIALLTGEARAWQAAPPPGPIWAAGSTGEIPAVAGLLRVIASLPEGRVILPGIDREMAEAHFSALASEHPEHPDAGIARLLLALGARRSDVGAFPALPATVTPGRAPALRRALLPAPALVAGWTPAPRPERLEGVSRLAPADEQEEAVAIALCLRGALEVPGARAALVTPDRQLARRVVAELGRFGVAADDSAGESLEGTPPAVFLRLLAAAAGSDYTPVALLALLKHPLFSAGLAPPEARAEARALEVALLRGPGPAPGLAALSAAAAACADGRAELIRRLEDCVAPFERVRAQATAPVETLLVTLIESAERLAATDREPGPARLWAFEEGEALATRLVELIAAAVHLPPIPPPELQALLEVGLEGGVVRSRRSLRTADGPVAEHPRVFIWGLLEARLQEAELIVLGGLTEGVWPPATDPGPWLSRPMRRSLGFASPEEAVGQAAHDFLGATLAAAEVVFSAPRRRDGQPAVPARWLVRLDAFLGQGMPEHPSLGWARALDRPAGPAKPHPAPAPAPALGLRPRQLAVTEIATWLADPYAIYAGHVLTLSPLPGLEETRDASDFGAIVHAGLKDFFDRNRRQWPAEAERRLAEALVTALAGKNLPPHLLAWWKPRLVRIAAWVATEETRRRAQGAPLSLWPEAAGKWRLSAPGGAFFLTGRADRIERRSDGGLAILDYKTGTLPHPAEVRDGRQPQLPLLAAMAEAGAFSEAFAGPVSELAYWRLTGGHANGEVASLGSAEEVAELTARAVAGLGALIAAFDDAARPYLAQPHPANRPLFSPYARLARVAEWTSVEE